MPNTVLGEIRISPGRVTAECNSKERADRLVAEVAGRLGDSAKLASTVHRSLDQELEAAVGQRDPAGVELRHWMGIENLVWGSDFPHQESEYPNSMKVIEQNFSNVPDSERHAMVCGNIAAFLGLDSQNQN